VIAKDGGRQDIVQTADDGLRIDTVHLDGHVVLAIGGEIDLATAGVFGAAIDDGLRRAGKVVLDFSNVTFMDSSGLNVLVAATGQNGAHDSVLIRNPPDSVQRLLSMTGLNEVIRIETIPSEHGGSADPHQSAS
jgi:stage II sporulation protein AA (anti-sigma F factor antagonist)